jgi:hypothetical protein
MKLLVALAAGWIAFVAADMIIYGSIHTDAVGQLMGTLIGNVLG